MEEFKKNKYNIKLTSNYKANYKKIKKQGKDIQKLAEVVSLLAEGVELDAKYKNHKLVNDKYFKDCNECHIEPDWLLIYRIASNQLILLLIATGSHSDLFNK